MILHTHKHIHTHNTEDDWSSTRIGRERETSRNGVTDGEKEEKKDEEDEETDDEIKVESFQIQQGNGI